MWRRGPRPAREAPRTGVSAQGPWHIPRALVAAQLSDRGGPKGAFYSAAAGGLRPQGVEVRSLDT